MVVAALSLGLAGCGSPAHGTFSVSPRRALLDVPVSVSLHGLDPGQRVTIEARASDYRSVGWRSTAHFRADGSGRITLADPSTGGSYTGTNAMGLFELMRPTTGHNSTFLTPDDGYPVRLTARTDSQLVASTTLLRVNPRAAGVTSRALTLAHDGDIGTLYRPGATSPRARASCSSAARRAVRHSTSVRRPLPGTATRPCRWRTSGSPGCRRRCATCRWSTS